MATPASSISSWTYSIWLARIHKLTKSLRWLKLHHDVNVDMIITVKDIQAVNCGHIRTSVFW
jgi:hypothetical protein